ncbi:hypothetical protein BGW80DRAFT_1379264 [Lactifluus volemus]|nr:hypothetical protein BGW80DRAFT_1379264 [Lactifluus volemus]
MPTPSAWLLTALSFDAWARLGSSHLDVLFSEQTLVHWYLSEDMFSETWENLGAFDKSL